MGSLCTFASFKTRGNFLGNNLWFVPIDLCLSWFSLSQVDFGPRWTKKHWVWEAKIRKPVFIYLFIYLLTYLYVKFCEDWRGGWGVPQDRPGPENKVTFSAPQPDCLILGSQGECGAASSATYSDQIVIGHDQEGLRRVSLGFFFGPWLM